MNRTLRRLLCLAVLTAPALRAADAPPLPDIGSYRDAAARWEDDIAALEALDAAEPSGSDGVLFIGSSSIRRWESIADDMAPYRPIRRGYGGAKFSDLVFYTERLVRPHQIRAIVIFVANDISGGKDDRSPGEVAGLFRHVLGTVRQSHPSTPVFYIAVTPTPSRFASWEAIRAANRACRGVCDSQPGAHFIATASAYLDAAGIPRPDLFVGDRLHLNATGYDLWAAIIKSHLDGVLGGAGVTPP